MKYAVNEEGVQALESLSVRITDSVADLYHLTMMLQSSANDSSDVLGPHKASLISSIKSIYEAIKQSAEPVKNISDTLKETAECYQEIIDNDRINSGNTGNNDSSQSSGGGHSGTVLTSTHKPYIGDYKQQVLAVQQDVKAGSGRNISSIEAERLLSGVRFFTGTIYQQIRGTYNNPNSNQELNDMRLAVDDYIHFAPKWQGRMYRGINVSKDTTEKLLSGNPIDMLGPSSWSSDINVAEKFSRGDQEVRIVFVLDNNKSGASVTHIGTCNGIESEITVPSGVKYSYNDIQKINKDGSDIVYIYVSEQEWFFRLLNMI